MKLYEDPMIQVHFVLIVLFWTTEFFCFQTGDVKNYAMLVEARS
jgi:hypothetical protein